MSAEATTPRNNFIRELVAEDVETGRFGAVMEVASVNDGPFTLVVDV